MQHIQSYISNLSFPTSLSELQSHVDLFDVEVILSIHPNMWKNWSWTAPKWIKAGDIVFFMHAETANDRIRALRKELEAHASEFNDAEYRDLMDALDRAKKLYDVYGGKIFAIGMIDGRPEYYRPEEGESQH